MDPATNAARTPRRRITAPQAARKTTYWGWGGAAQAGTELRILDNPLVGPHQALGEAVEQVLHELLEHEDLGRLEVRLRVCRDDSDAFRFICKLEGPPALEPDREQEQWRWWSPLMETAEDLRTALREGLAYRRQRLAVRGAYGTA